MKTVFEHIEHIKGKPHHVRKRIAFATAASGTAVVALVWLVGNVSMGVFALQPTSFADIVDEQGSIETRGGGSQNIAGAAAALENNDTSARIEIVDTASSTRNAKKIEKTTIPF